MNVGGGKEPDSKDVRRERSAAAGGSTQTTDRTRSTDIMTATPTASPVRTRESPGREVDATRRTAGTNANTSTAATRRPSSCAQRRIRRTVQPDSDEEDIDPVDARNTANATNNSDKNASDDTRNHDNDSAAAVRERDNDQSAQSADDEDMPPRRTTRKNAGRGGRGESSAPTRGGAAGASGGRGRGTAAGRGRGGPSATPARGGRGGAPSQTPARTGRASASTDPAPNPRPTTGGKEPRVAGPRGRPRPMTYPDGRPGHNPEDSSSAEDDDDEQQTSSDSGSASDDSDAHESDAHESDADDASDPDGNRSDASGQLSDQDPNPHPESEDDDDVPLDEVARRVTPPPGRVRGGPGMQLEDVEDSEEDGDEEVREGIRRAEEDRVVDAERRRLGAQQLPRVPRRAATTGRAGASDDVRRDVEDTNPSPPPVERRTPETRRGDTNPPETRQPETRQPEQATGSRRQGARRETPAGSAGQHEAMLRRSTRTDENFPEDNADADDDTPLPTIPNRLIPSKTARRPGVRYEQPVRAIDMRDMTGRHAWEAGRCTQMDFASFVTHGTGGRQDMVNFREIRERDGMAAAVAEWTYFRNSHLWFEIPSTVRTDRTFARDETEAIYLDHMDAFLRRTIRTYQHIEMRNLPLVATGHTLMGRWYNRWAFNRSFVVEAVWRGIHGIMVPADAASVDVEPENLAHYRWNFPPTQDWYSEEWFPTGVLTPTPPAVFYYHWEIMNTTDPDRLDMWHRIIELEWAALFVAIWWHDAARGQRAYVVPHQTIEWLRARMQNIPIDPDTPFGNNDTTSANYILDTMRFAANAHPDFHNTVLYPGTGLRPSRFVWSTGGTGIFDSNAIAGREFVRTRAQDGRLMERHVQRDEWGLMPRINHNRPQPRPDGEPPRQRRRMNPPHNAAGTGLHPVTNRPVFYTENTSPTYRTDRTGADRHSEPTEDGREEVPLEEWLVRYGAPTAAVMADARRLTDDEVRNGLRRTPANPTLPPRLVFATVQVNRRQSHPPRRDDDDDGNRRFDPPDDRHHNRRGPYGRDDHGRGGGGGGFGMGGGPGPIAT